MRRVRTLSLCSSLPFHLEREGISNVDHHAWLEDDGEWAWRRSDSDWASVGPRDLQKQARPHPPRPENDVRQVRSAADVADLAFGDPDDGREPIRSEHVQVDRLANRGAHERWAGVTAAGVGSP